MPKLTKKVASQVDKAEAASGSFLLPEGRYAAQLRGVVQKDGNEYPYWVWEFENLHDEEGGKKPGRQWNNTSLSPKSLGFLKATFEAFGYTSDSDTDELVGEWVVLYLVQEPIGKGPKAGQLRNSVQSLSEFNPDEWDFDPEDVASSKEDEPADEY
ncbi:hypothetical protein SEA_SAPO_29 [Gordonia phage Sapo]|nr:hypothetical protein SEA_SAPO_29 [Gordonia phage Sapo]